MKFAVIAAFSFILPTFAYAEGEFEKHKAEMLQEIDQRIQKMQEHRGCVSGSADREGLKKCFMAMKDWRHGEKMERLEKRKDRLDRRMKKLEEKKGS